MDSALLISGVDKNYLDLTSEELDEVKAAIKPAFKSDNYPEEKFKWFFKLFKIYYQRKYKSESDENEKYAIFEKNLELMNEINSQNKSFSVAINKFADKEEIAMPPGLMKSLYDEDIKNKQKSEYPVLTKPKKKSFKFDINIKNEIDNMKSVKKNKGMIKGPDEGLQEFAVSTNNLTDTEETSLENSI